ncbi:MAG TPA: glycerol kinase GlpK [Tepidisphaeraceae bacterium]|jgi:glycerol kinase|nr:glycerol kinase GlpK [Tepidisphaeraceae bacterium]
MANILAIDQSTSATKALLYDTTGKLLEKASIEHRQIYPQPGWVEHDAEEIWRNTFDAIAKLKPSDPACLSITNQRETIVIFDRATGKPLHNAIVWQCRRGDPICAELKHAGHDEIVSRKSGLKIDTYFSASKLTWLMRNQPEIAKKLKSGEALIGTIDAYLIYRLTNGKVFATDHTNASRTLLLDISSLKWDEELCRMFEVPMGALPEVRESTARFGETDLNGLLSKPIPICGVMGDSQASLVAHRCFEPGMAKVTLGSGSSVLLNLGSKLQYGGDGALSTIAWTHARKATYSFEGIINYSAGTIAWLKDQLGLIQNAQETESAACAIADNGGVYLVPAFAGLSAPHWSPEARAAIVGMTAHANRNHVIRAALESIAYQIRDVLEMMRDHAGIKLSAINADGGATRNAFLMQFIADMTGLEVTAAQMPDCSSLGAAMAGMLGMKIYSSFDELASLKQEVTTYRPAMRASDVERFYAGWKRAVKQVLAGTGS